MYSYPKKMTINAINSKPAITNPHKIRKEGEVNIAHYFLNDKMLRVIFKKMDKAYMVITAYITHKGRYGSIK